VIERRCVNCGRSKLSHSIGLQCFGGSAVGYLPARYSPVTETTQNLLMQAAALARIKK